MKILSTGLVLLTAGVYTVAAMRDTIHTPTAEAHEEDHTLNPQDNRNGWVNPEDLAPMPQCIAQQDPSIWLSVMTKCTSQRCTRHFGIICTHHQWLTQLSCLSIGFSSDVIKGYLPYCGRSVLTKTQLYQWTRHITDRTWLVEPGDVNGLDNLSPSSLVEGSAAVDVIENAPRCLTGSISAVSMEPFRRVIASCSFTSITQHTGNAARPWEYNQSLRSMIALDFETVGYDLTSGSIGYGDYFDKECFCNTFTIDAKTEPCSGPGQLDLTKERLWVNATCGSTRLPDNWTDILKTTVFAYIPIEDWHWPACVADIPNQTIELTDQCATDACEVHSNGYCKVKRAIDRACFCRNINYDTCGGSCQVFETRIDYVNWLHGLCGKVQDWHGLPDNWRQLAAPNPLDMIPWPWTLKPANHTNVDNTTPLETETCASNDWKLGSLALVNIATFLAVLVGDGISTQRTAKHPYSWSWYSKGALMAALQLLVTWFSTVIVRTTPGYENVPGIQLILFWCSMPRLSWVTILLNGFHPFETKNFSTAASSLFAEMILQFLSSYYMYMTVSYGLKHDFYFGRLERAERGGLAETIYNGALLWLLIAILAFLQLMLITRSMVIKFMGSGNLDLAKRQRTRKSARLRLLSEQRGDYPVYGTFPDEPQKKSVSQKLSMELYAVTVISMTLLWIAQCMFWSGFIGLSSEEFCPPKLAILTTVWVTSSLMSAAVGVVF